LFADTIQVDELLGGAGPWSVPPDLFKGERPPEGWVRVTHGAALWLCDLDPLPRSQSIIKAATVVWAPEDREVAVKVARETMSQIWLDDKLFRRYGLPGPGDGPFAGRILLNGKAVYDSRPGAAHPPGPIQLRKGRNTLVLLTELPLTAPGDPGSLFVFFHDAKTGKRVRGLVFCPGQPDRVPVADGR
jgi:hypothetical protein